MCKVAVLPHRIQLAGGQTQKAEINLKLALDHSSELTPASVARTKSNLGYLYFTRGEFDKAKTPLKEAADAGNSNAVSTLKAVDQAQKIYNSGRASLPQMPRVGS
jgi:uncharacterized protein HemY